MKVKKLKPQGIKILKMLHIFFGTFVLGPCINNNVVIASQLRDAAFSNPEFLTNIETTQVWGTIQTILLKPV